MLVWIVCSFDERIKHYDFALKKYKVTYCSNVWAYIEVNSPEELLNLPREIGRVITIDESGQLFIEPTFPLRRNNQ